MPAILLLVAACTLAGCDQGYDLKYIDKNGTIRTAHFQSYDKCYSAGNELLRDNNTPLSCEKH